MSDKKLIAEARAAMNRNEDTGWLWACRLASALEASQPSENDQEATEAEVDKAARALHMAKCCSLSGDSPHDFPEASELFAAGVVLNAVPRAAVPDAATEQAKQELAACLELRAYWRNQTVKARAERDAALAAIERCREVADALRTRYAENSDAEYFVRQIVAALDGAPEPDLEYRVEYQIPGGETHVTRPKATFEEAYDFMLGNIHGGTVMSRSKAVPAGPWLPAEGERRP